MSRCPHIDHRGKRCIRSAHWFGAHTYEPLKPVGRKKLREASDNLAFRLEVEQRARGLCEARFAVRAEGGYVCEGSKHAGEHAHHIAPSDRDLGLHDPDRGLWLCAKAHDWVHRNPADASTLGLLRPETDRLPEDAA